MLDKNYIKPIPKTIIAAIKRKDKKHYPMPCGNTRCNFICGSTSAYKACTCDI